MFDNSCRDAASQVHAGCGADRENREIDRGVSGIAMRGCIAERPRTLLRCRIRFVYRWLASGVIPVRLSDDEVKQIDFLVKRAGRSSRSRVIREILHEHLTQKLSSDQNVDDLVGALMRLSSKGREPVKLRFKTTVTGAVSEGRA